MVRYRSEGMGAVNLKQSAHGLQIKPMIDFGPHCLAHLWALVQGFKRNLEIREYSSTIGYIQVIWL